MNRSQKKIAKEEAGKIIINEIQDSLDSSKSPVSGGRFKALLKDGTASLLFEEGDLRSAIVSKNRQNDEIEVGVYKSSELKKAYNHNIGDTLPRRQFIPDEDQTFKRPIMEKVNRRIKAIKEGSPKEEKKTLSQLLDEAFNEATIQTELDDANISVTIGGLLDILGN